MSTLEGKLVANNMKVGIVVARFNEFITNKLLGGADVCFYGAEYDVKARKAWNRRSETEESK